MQAHWERVAQTLPVYEYAHAWVLRLDAFA
jgi:hypothetical protein